MEGIEISFPLSVCRDLMENVECQLWRFYQASISPGKTDGKKTLGALRTRVVSSPATGTQPFVELVLTFPRHTIKCPAVRGNLRCSVEVLNNATEAGQSSDFVSRKAQLDNSETDVVIADDAATAQNCQDKTKRFDKLKAFISGRNQLKAFISERKTGVSLSDDTTEGHGRPSRRREKPSKYKDYVATVDLPKTKEDQEKEQPSVENTSNSEDSQSGSSGTSGKVFSDKGKTRVSSHTESNETTERLPTTQTPPKPGKRIVRKYDKLIKNLQQASAKSGLEMLSVISRIKSDTNNTDGRDSSDMLLVMNASSNDVENNSSKGSEQSQSSLKQFESVKKGGTKEQTSANTPLSSACASEKKYLDKANIQMGTSSAAPSYLTSFPRKFPSSLTRTDVLLTNTPVSNPQKRQSDSVADAAGEILSKYKKIQPMEKDPAASKAGYRGDDVADENGLPSPARVDCSTSNTQPQNNDRPRVVIRQQTSDHPAGISSHPSLTQSPVEEPEDSTQNGLTGANIALPSSTFHQGLKVHAVLMAPASGVNQQESAKLTSGQSSHGGQHQHQTNGQRSDRRNSGKSPKALVPAMADHDYTDAVLGRKTLHSTKALRTLVRPISLSRHISARVECVVEGKGSSLVTISGLNSKAAGGKTYSQNFSLRLSPDGLPIADSLDDVMTDTFRRRNKHWESLRQALSAPSSPQVCMKVDEMPVLNEVVLTHSGHLRPDRHSRPGRPRKYPLLGRSRLKTSPRARQTLVTSHSSPTPSLVVRSGSDYTLAAALKSGEEEDGTGIAVQVTQSGDAEVYSHDNQTIQKLALPQELIIEGSDPASHADGSDLFLPPSGQSSLGAAVVEVVMEKEQPVRAEKETVTEVVVENEEAVKNSQQPPAVKFCKYCLRLFPASVILLKHVKTAHTSYAENAEHMEYLDSLRRDSRITCPYCPGNHTLSNEYKLRSHLKHHHGDQLGPDFGEATSGIVSPQCEVCLVHFHALSELKAHATLVHNSDVFACNQCPEVFVRDTSLATHMKEAHSNPSAFMCKACDSGFDTRHLLLAHKQMVHGYQPKQYSCQNSEIATSDGDSKTIDVTQAVTTSRVVHTQGRGEGSWAGLSRIKCPCCNARFAHFWQQREHRQHVHSGPIPVHCPFCGLGYQTLTPMLTHLHQHLESDVALQLTVPGSASATPHKLPQRCPFCNPSAAFLKVSALVNHVMEDHHDLFPFTCSVCHQQFISEEPLRVHLQQAHELVDVTVATATEKTMELPADTASFQLTQNLVVTGVSSSSLVPSDLTGAATSLANSELSSDSLDPQQVQNIMPLTTSEVNSSPGLSSDSPVICYLEGGAGLETQDNFEAAVSHSDSNLPISEDLNSDLFFSLPADAQRSIQLITQQGKRAMLTIADGKGHMQKVSFIQGGIQSSASSQLDPSPSPSPALLPPLIPSPSVLENLVYPTASAVKAENVIGIPPATGIVTGASQDFRTMMQVVPVGISSSRASTKADLITGVPGYVAATDTIILTASGIPTDTEITQVECPGNEISDDLHNYAVTMETEMEAGVAREMEIVSETLDGAAEIQVVQDTPEVVTNFEVITSDTEASARQGALVRVSSEVRDNQEENETSLNKKIEGAVEFSELSAVSLQSCEADTISLAASEFS